MNDVAMARLRQRFHARAAADRQEIEAALRDDDRAGLLRMAHGLAGIAGIFGYAEVGERAAVLEQAVEEGAASEPLQAVGSRLLDALADVGGEG